MTDPEKELQAPDPQAAAAASAPAETSPTQIPQTKEEAKTHPEVESIHQDDHGSSETDSDNAEERRNALAATRSAATDVSVDAEALAARPSDRPWYKKLNPLRWGAVPPIPTERGVSREYGAGFFSHLTFNWMSPLMTVSLYFSNQIYNKRPKI